MKTDTPQNAPKTIYLKDYAPTPYKVAHVDMRFDIFKGETIVTTKTQFTKNGENDEDIFLNGEELELVSCKLDGKEITTRKSDLGITIPAPGKEVFRLEIVTKIVPEKNTALEGLYCSNGNYTTQCEAEGFRKITYFYDRPDVMATFRVQVIADKKSCPVLLSNGNLIEEGDVSGDRHYTIWDDPTPKPCYLFALVAGDLVHIKDKFTTMSGTDVDLYIYVRAGDETQCDHAMQSLIKSMKWDEDVYGREYQYDRFNIVAVSDFNMGAMENTALNIFNTALVLAHQNTATDHDFIRVESVIAHEYFHNWTGNRVTCRDWFQLSLKEGLTVFRDQEFSADMHSPAVQRIDDVSHLRRGQFTEDASPLAHPVRPDNYIEINNFYTMTIYEKGAEVIRMFRTLMGGKLFRDATDLYFDRHDGQAVTINDWAAAMEDASGQDFEQFKLWYDQAGTPKVNVSSEYDAKEKIFTLHFEQSIPDTPGQSDKKSMHIPIAIGLMGSKGKEIGETTVISLKKAKETFKFHNINEKPVPSILRNFSAPVNLKTDLTEDDIAFLMVHDTDGFNKWEAGQNYALRTIQTMMDEGAKEPSEKYLKSFEALLQSALDDNADKALMARALTLPDFQAIAAKQVIIDPDIIDLARSNLKKSIKRNFIPLLEKIYKQNEQTGAFDVSGAAMGQRALRNVALDYLTSTDGTGCAALATQHYTGADNMTDRMAALGCLMTNKNAEREDILQQFYDEFKGHLLVIDKWFGIQASAKRTDIFEVLSMLKSHKNFSMKNPNRVRSLFGAFAMNNPVMFHEKSGKGYAFLKEAIIELNTLNPQIAARMVTPFREWPRYTEDRQKMMKAALKEILEIEKISPNVFEIVSKSLSA